MNLGLSLSSTLLLLLHSLTISESLIVRRHYHDGLLYEDYAADSEFVRYTTTSGEGWDNLTLLVATYHLRDKSMFCSRGPGAWLLYQGQEYKYGTTSQLKLLYGEHCVAADNVDSLQPLGAVYVNIEDASAVVAFTERYFASKAASTSDTISQSIQSAIFVGTANWTVEVDGRKTCMIVQNAGDLCLMEDLRNSFQAAGDPDTDLQVTITKGCGDDENMEGYQLQNCFRPGYHLLTYDFEFTLPNMKKICAEDYDPNDKAKNKFLEVVNLWKNRMSPPSNPSTSTVPNAPERIGTLTEMVRIMGNTCPGVSPMFLEIVKQIYLVHVKFGDLWNVTVTPDGTRLEQSSAKWSRAQAFVMKCGAIGDSVEVGCTPDDISEMKNEKEVAVIEDFLSGDNYDYVIENVWLLLNYVATYCNYHLGFKNNDWAIFPLLFKRDFLYPLQEQWKSPGKWATFYPLMFNGFELEDEKKAMIACVQAIIKQTPFYDPLARPPSFYRKEDSEAKDIIGGKTDGDTSSPAPAGGKVAAAAPTTAATGAPPTARRKRQESEEAEINGKKQKSFRTSDTKVPATSAAPSFLSTLSTHNQAARNGKRAPPTILPIGIAHNPEAVTTIQIGAPTTPSYENDEEESTVTEKGKKGKRGRGKGKRGNAKKGRRKGGKSEKAKESKLLKSTVVEKQAPPEVN